MSSLAQRAGGSVYGCLKYKFEKLTYARNAYCGGEM